MDETALSFAEIKALCAGNPLVKEKTDLELDIRKLRVLQSDYKSQHYKLEDNLLKHYPRSIKSYESSKARLESDAKLVQENTKPNDKGFSPMQVGGKLYTEKEDAGKALLMACKRLKIPKGQNGAGPESIGQYRGLELELTAYKSFLNNATEYELALKGAMTYRVKLGGDVFGNLTRINNELADIPARIENHQAELDDLQKQVAAAKAELARPFAYEAELEQKVARLAEVDTELDLDKDDDPELMDDDEPDEGDPPDLKVAGRDAVDDKPGKKHVASTMPSILAQLKSPPPASPPPGRAKAATDISI